MDRRLRFLPIFAFSVLISTWLGAATATAEIPDAAAESMTEGARLFQEQDYAGAAVVFRRAFEIHPDARFLYNAARASHRGGNLEQAYRYYVGALQVEEMHLDPETAAQASAHQRALEIGWTSTAIGDKRKQSLPEKAQFEESRWGAKGTSGLALSALGGVFLGTSGLFAWRTSSRMETLESGDVDSLQAYTTTVEAIERNQRWGKRTLYGGGSLLAIGAGLVAWELGGSDETKVGNARLELDGRGVRAVWEVRFE